MAAVQEIAMHFNFILQPTWCFAVLTESVIAVSTGYAPQAGTHKVPGGPPEFK